MAGTIGRPRWAWAASVAALLAAPAAVAVGRPAAPPPCTAEGDALAVRSVTADLDLVLEDGRILRLVGIDPVRDTANHPAQAADARARLQGWLAGRAVGVRLLGAQPDRWSRWPALVFATPGGGGAAGSLPVAVALVDAGLARGRPEAGAAACWAALLAAEGQARQAGLGLWGDPYYAVRRADDAGALSDVAGGMVIAEGRVGHVGRTRTRVYLDLGPRGGLSLRLDRRDLFILDQLGPGDKTWVGRSIRVRGTVDDRNGPQIDLVDGGQLEVLPEPAAGATP